jgi:MFS family permease
MLSVPSPEPPREIHRRHYVGIFLLAFATLLLELALTRVLSVTLWYHFGFLVISTALLGFGVSGVVLALWSWLREKAELDRALSVIALLFGVLTIGCFWLAQRIPFDPFSLLTDKRQWWSTPLYFVVVSMPFFCSGLALSLLFTRGAAHVNRLYAFDLFGAGLGCGAIALVMPQFGGSGSVVVAAGVGLLSAVVFGLRQARGWAVAGLILAVATGPLAVVADRLLPITITSNKRQPAVAPVATEWNTFSRIDTYGNLPPNPRRPLPHRAFFFDAGTAVTAIPDLRPDWRTAAKAFEGRYRYDSQLAYLGKQQPRLLIIGSGAGAEVFAGMVHGAASITAVEINPIINRAIVENRDGYWGGLFDEPAVTLVTEEGRSFVRRSKERFDAIISAHTISNAAIASGTLSLAENYVLTREAFDDYLDHLVDDGVLYFTRPEYQMPRLFATGREALEARGVRGVQAHFYALKGSATIGEGRSVFYAIFLMKR